MNLVRGDVVSFTLPKFEGGSFSRFSRGRGATYLGDEDYSGTIENDWYDSNRRHWFSVRLVDGKLKRVQGKNLYGSVSRYAKGEHHDSASADKAFRKGIW